MPFPELTSFEMREWRSLLLGEAGGTLLEQPVTSGYSSDRVGDGQKDHMSIQPDVDAFARLVCLKDTEPPLAIALLGAWGSGKTFFMRKMQEAVRTLCDEQRADPDQDVSGQSAFATEIRQIEFNAWTYADKNLLASLAVELFEKLLALTTGETVAEAEDRKKNEALLKKLETANAALRDAEAEKSTADGNLKTVESDLSEAIKHAEEKRAALAASEAEDFLSVLATKAIAADGAVPKALKNLGLESVTKTQADIIQLRDQTGSLAGRLKLLGQRFAKHPVKNHPFLWIAVFGIAGLAALPFVTDKVDNPIFLQFSAAITAVIASISKGVSKVSGFLEPIEAAAAEYDQQRADIENKIEEKVEKARKAVADHETEVERLSAELHARQEAVTKAQAAIDADTPLARLNRFIHDRANTSDYRQHLGIVRLLKDDFEYLSHLMKKQQGAEANPTLPKIDRIILYIDDLDRCKPATVKAVMEAVHLLLSSDLFVVVVGADEKWVSKSLSEEYKELLTEKAEDADQATSADFVEKIFQIPFWLSQMTRGDMERFLDGLLEGQTEPPTDEDRTYAETLRETVRTRATERNDSDSKYFADTTGIEADPEPWSLPAVVPVADRLETIAAVQFTPGETAFMRTLGPLIGRTPRSAKRYVNVYRLIRARLQGEDLRIFLGQSADGGPPAYPFVQFLLALETSHTRLAGGVEDYLRYTGETDFAGWFNFITKVDNPHLDPKSVEVVWQGADAVATACRETLPKDYKKWCQRVSRYSFRRSQWVA